MVKFLKVTSPAIIPKRIKVLDGNTETFYLCTDQSYDFAEKNFKEGEIVEMVLDKKVIVKLAKEGVANMAEEVTVVQDAGFVCSDCGKTLTSNKYTKCYDCFKKISTQPPVAVDTGFVCTDCGITLKDGRYTKCYICNQKNPVRKTEKKWYGKSLEEQETIRRQAVGHMVSRSLMSLQGQVDPNNIPEIIKVLYKTYDELSKG